MNNNLLRFADSKVYFRCPICTKSMDMQGNSLICRNRHCFDISRYGYVNLLLKSPPKTNYSKQSFNNRHQVLEYGMYDVVLEKITQFISDTPSIKSILDVGCGEGFYARQVQQRTARRIFAFDLSKEAIQIASKKDKCKVVNWFIADLSKIPLKDGSMDCILDIFSPAHYKEFQRLLSSNGYVIKVIPTKNHLREIRTKVVAHLKNPDYSNQSVIEYFEKYLKTISRETVSATIQLSPEQRMSFIEMTPLLFCVEKDSINWDTLTHLTIEAEVLIGTY
ncbi:TPA: methyltransferase domain-containing protein [Streptococcus equi subsp. zooepidemicus]|nr:methyltransferase domain-containing protein [Streptococcus equi subsp. zooepidemicus]HEL5667290.1 methyltransferase domain-containing protein [Clostridioides difficile]